MKRFGRIIGINAGLIVIVLVAAELIFGNWIFGPSYSILNVPRNETRYFDVSEFISPGKVITYTRDEHGLRGDYGGNPANIGILAIGGSTTNERFLDDTETWVQQLQKALKAAGRNVSVVNAAVDGQSTVGHIAAFDLWFPNIPRLRPDIVLAYVGINDVAVGDSREQYDTMQSPEHSRQLRQYIMNHSVLYNQFRRIRGMFVAQRTRLMHGANSYRTGTWKPVNDWVGEEKVKEELGPALTEYRKRLRTLASRIRRFGAQPVYVTQPRGDYRYDDGELNALVQKGAGEKISNRGLLTMQLFNDVTLAVCGELSLRCIDLAGELEFGPRDFYDSVHTMPSGSRKIARFLARNLGNSLK
jgi:lysophospholipase L1-like esterase